MSRFDLTDEERATLVRELRDIVANDRFPVPEPPPRRPGDVEDDDPLDI
jgi:hypothetical protein